MTDTSLIDASRPARTSVSASQAPTAQDHEQQAAESGAQHDLCEAWSTWCSTRRFYGPPPLAMGVIGKLASKSRPPAPGAGNATCGADLMALHLAITAQPADALDRKVFELHYRWRVRNIKAAAAQLGIGKSHWYRLLKSFRARVVAAHGDILRENLAAADLLPHAKKRDSAAEID